MDPKKYLSMEDAIKILNNIIEDYNNQYKSDVLNIDIVALQKLIEEYNNLKQIEEAHRIENGKLREENKIKDEYLGLIQFMAVDYDGERKAKGLMGLIDQLSDYAVKGINCDTKSEVYLGKNILREEIDSHIPHID